MQQDGSTRAGTLALDTMIEQLEQRLEVERTYGREVDLSLRELLEIAPDQWPETPRDSIRLAVRLLQLGYRWLARAANKSRALEMCAELSLLEIHRALPGITAEDDQSIRALIDAWRDCTLVPQDLLVQIYLDDAQQEVLDVIRTRLRNERMRLGNDMGALISMLQSGTQSKPRDTREHSLFLARLEARAGNLDAAVELLDHENATDPRVLATWAEVSLEAGNVEDALERLRKAVIVSDSRIPLRERIIHIQLSRKEIEQAAEQLMTLLGETNDPLHWFAFGPVFEEADPGFWKSMQERLPNEAPGAHLQLLMQEGDVDAVIAASEARSFTADMLWSAGDFLAESHPKTAAGLYERAILLQGAVAQSRKEITDLVRRVESVIPFFTNIGKKTKPRRLARELLPTARNAQMLRREFERLFDTSFG